MSKSSAIIAAVLILCVLAAAFFFYPAIEKDFEKHAPEIEEFISDSGIYGEESFDNEESFVFDYSEIPEYSGTPYIELNGNEPLFTESNMTVKAFEEYSDLDFLGRCGVCFANVCRELMPTAERESISSVKPTGWQSVMYDFVDCRSLYNRCHLIGYQLSGENANEKNLITGTRYLNTMGMLPFENMVADYVKETENHVLYRVTPVFVDDELVARGVLMEGYSVEDGGEGISYFVFCYNVQPGVIIDYKTGDSREDPKPTDVVKNYVLNTNSHKFHRPDCTGISDMKESARQNYKGTRENLIAQGYAPCGKCKP